MREETNMICQNLCKNDISSRTPREMAESIRRGENYMDPHQLSSEKSCIYFPKIIECLVRQLELQFLNFPNHSRGCND